jgi:uncharacterized membrane-anchored protein YitT (DUF2179 family)
VGLVLLGSLIAAVGLQLFLIPNHLLDGGVVGISIIAAHLSHLPLGLFLIVLNIPFIFLGYRKFGLKFALFSSFGIIVLALLTTMFHPEMPATDQPLLAAVFGGLMIGIGAGLVIRYGGTLDGSDTVAILVDKVTSFSVGEVIMFMNIIILTGSGFVFGWDNAMYSIIAYFVAHKAIDVTVEGLNESRSVWIVSKHYEQIGDAIEQLTGRKVTYMKDSNSKVGLQRGVILSVITRFEEQKVKSIIHSVDNKAFVVISNAHEILGKNFTT